MQQENDRDIVSASPLQSSVNLSLNEDNTQESEDGVNTFSEVELDAEHHHDTSLPTPPIVIQSPVDSIVSHDNFEASQYTTTDQSPNHRRIDSVPLRRYEIQNSLPASSAKHHFVEDDLIDTPSSYNSWQRDTSYSETEDAGLDFVEVKLGASEERSPYGSGSHFASRSAVEIRQDSISSNSEAARNLALEAEDRDRRSSGQYLHERRKTDSDDESISSRGSRRTERSVEGRYMGRRSRPVSRATSPDADESALHTAYASPTQPRMFDAAAGGSGAGPTITMAVAGEDGEISIVDTTATLSPVKQTAEENGSMSVARDQSSRTASQSELKEEGIKESPESKADVTDPDAKEGVEEATMSTAASGNSLSDIADKEQGLKDKKKRRESSNKPSALEQHMSRTRMMNLPPKSKQEDVKHLHDYEEMMKLSREKEMKKQEEIEEKRRQKDAEFQENMKVWESEILPSWTRARREAHLRKLWWKGIPPSIRGRLWAMACGNNQMLPRNLFSKASAEAEERIRQGTFPLGDLRALEEDIEQTLPSLKLFQKETGALYNDLYSVLCALVIVRLDRRSGTDKEKAKQSNQDDDGTVQVYQQGFSSLSAMLLSNLTPSETLIALLNLITERPWLCALYSSTPTTTITAGKGDKREDAAGYERVFDTLLADQMPKVYANMQARGVRPSAYVKTWIKTLYVPFLPFDLVARLWDCILLEEGDALVFRISIALYSLLSVRLYVPEKQELISVLKGNNRAALSVWQRIRANGSAEATSPPPLSPSTDQSKRFSIAATVEASDEMVPLDNIYGGQYDINETNLFQVLEEQASWWKDSTLERLLDRELVT